MTHGALIEIRGLSKRFGRAGDPRAVQAVNDLTFTAARPDAGTATLDGAPYASLDRPAARVGSALGAAFHPAHTGRTHLDILRRGIGLSKTSIDAALDLVGMSKDADRKTGGYSLGMRQRLALAGALLGDPATLILDEPANGLDPEGIRWMRQFLRHLASEGRTILLSSHLLSEVQQTVDDIVVIRRGELAFAGTPEELQTDTGVGVESLDNAALAAELHRAGAHVSGQHSPRMRVMGMDAAGIGRVALNAGIVLTHLAEEHAGLEDRFLELVDGEQARPEGGSR